jgi:hypothetical protein
MRAQLAAQDCRVSSLGQVCLILLLLFIYILNPYLDYVYGTEDKLTMNTTPTPTPSRYIIMKATTTTTAGAGSHNGRTKGCIMTDEQGLETTCREL